MWNARNNSVCLLLISGLLAAGREPCVAVEPSKATSDRPNHNVIVVSMRPNVEIDSRIIRLVDIASITGGDAVLRNQIKQLDIEDSLSSGETVTILPSQIEFRMRLAGIDVDKVSIRGNSVHITIQDTRSPQESKRITGAAATSVASSALPKKRRAVDFGSMSVDEGPLEREVIQVAKNCVLSKLPWPAENIDVRLAQPLSAEVCQEKSAAGYECSAEIRSSGPAVGRVQVRVFVESPKKSTFDVPVLLEVRHFENVVLAAKAIERGHRIAATDLYVDRQDVTEMTDYCSVADELIGTTAKRSIRALMPVKTNDSDGHDRSETSILIKRRESVRMIARLGALSVTATGEALQEGRIGETVRIRNTESNAIVQGRVTGPGEVEISF